MKYCLFILGIIVASCQEKAKRQVQLPSNTYVLFKDANLKNSNGIWLWKGEKFNGYIIEKFDSLITDRKSVV